MQKDEKILFAETLEFTGQPPAGLVEANRNRKSHTSHAKWTYGEVTICGHGRASLQHITRTGPGGHRVWVSLTYSNTDRPGICGHVHASLQHITRTGSGGHRVWVSLTCSNMDRPGERVNAQRHQERPDCFLELCPCGHDYFPHIWCAQFLDVAVGTGSTTLLAFLLQAL